MKREDEFEVYVPGIRCGVLAMKNWGSEETKRGKLRA